MARFPGHLLAHQLSRKEAAGKVERVRCGHRKSVEMNHWIVWSDLEIIDPRLWVGGVVW